MTMPANVRGLAASSRVSSRAGMSVRCLLEKSRETSDRSKREIIEIWRVAFRLLADFWLARAEFPVFLSRWRRILWHPR